MSVTLKKKSLRFKSQRKRNTIKKGMKMRGGVVPGILKKFLKMKTKRSRLPTTGNSSIGLPTNVTHNRHSANLVNISTQKVPHPPLGSVLSFNQPVYFIEGEAPPIAKPIAKPEQAKVSQSKTSSWFRDKRYIRLNNPNPNTNTTKQPTSDFKPTTKPTKPTKLSLLKRMKMIRKGYNSFESNVN